MLDEWRRAAKDAFEQDCGKIEDCDDEDWWFSRLGLWIVAWDAAIEWMQKNEESQS